MVKSRELAERRERERKEKGGGGCTMLAGGAGGGSLFTCRPCLSHQPVVHTAGTFSIFPMTWYVIVFRIFKG